MNWRREAAHITGGIISGCVVQGICLFVSQDIGVIVKIWGGLSLFGVIVTKEIMEDCVSQSRLKTVMDVIFWVGPYCGVVLWH